LQRAFGESRFRGGGDWPFVFFFCQTLYSSNSSRMAQGFEGNYMLNDLAGKREERAPGQAISGQVIPGTTDFVFRTLDGCALCVSVVSDKIIRFRYAPTGVFPPDFSYAIDSDYQPVAPVFLEFKERPELYRITTDRLICTIAKDGLKTRILDRSGTVLSEDERGFHWEYDNETGNEIVKMTKRVQAGEHYFGLGDKASNANLRGQRFTLWGMDRYGYEKNSDPLYKNIPFYLSLQQRAAHGIFFDNTFASTFDFAAERTNVTSFWAAGGEMNYYFIYGPSLLEVTRNCRRFGHLVIIKVNGATRPRIKSAPSPRVSAKKRSRAMRFTSTSITWTVTGASLGTPNAFRSPAPSPMIWQNMA
jgi:alpha-glucosidase